MKSTTIAPLPEPLVRLAKLAACLASLTLTGGVCGAQPNYSVAIPKQTHGIPPKNASMARPADPASSTNNGILYHGGPVMNSPHGTNMYYIWYGTWDQSSKDILTYLAEHIGGSPYFNINTTYYDFDKEGERDSVLNTVNYVASVTTSAYPMVRSST